MRFAADLSLVLTAIRTLISEQSAGEETATKSVGIKLVPIRQGSFLMGSTVEVARRTGLGYTLRPAVVPEKRGPDQKDSRPVFVPTTPAVFVAADDWRLGRVRPCSTRPLAPSGRPTVK
jgi:hypothetical protein